jgi:hypothetical protein
MPNYFIYVFIPSNIPFLPEASSTIILIEIKKPLFRKTARTLKNAQMGSPMPQLQNDIAISLIRRGKGAEELLIDNIYDNKYVLIIVEYL